MRNLQIFDLNFLTITLNPTLTLSRTLTPIPTVSNAMRFVNCADSQIARNNNKLQKCYNSNRDCEIVKAFLFK